MKLKSSILYLSTLMFVFTSLTSCVTPSEPTTPTVPFTQAIKEKYKLTEDDMKSIQFYTSHTIVLERGQQNSKEKKTEGGELTVKNSKSSDKVIIKAGTPGVVTSVMDANRVSVSFEDGEGMFLVFGDAHDKKGKYTLLAPKWEGGRGTIEYGGKTYNTAPGSSTIYLAFRMKSLNHFKEEKRVAGGKTVGGK